jgi:hypothetical protein
MSKEVPTDRALSDEDRRHLRQLGSFGSHLETRIDQAFPPDPEELAAFERDQRKYLSSMNGSGLTEDEQNLMQDENEALRRQVAELTAQLAAGGAPGSKVPSYTGWKKAELEAEIDRVNGEDAEAKLPKGTVVEMVTALTEYFAE